MPKVIGAVIAAVAITCILSTLLFLYLRKKYLNLERLPPEVRWFYENYQNNPQKWEKIGV
jgi:hypothetical protein